ncbi:MAG TPA: U32 family peptidase [Desulfitobacterium dehalogenans]|uniref:U32 family peptidase n=1 Tax=Desulfitobacterium dehalogenans TaxID=36854 RepID=A0A7C6Z6Q0_9FIRM|nr:U32 family peptidase [Desulfitobacterium dehalogenans]
MNILAPVSSVKEAEQLIAHGADELYCGIGLGALKNKPGNTGREIWINRRESGNANIPDLESLSRLVDLAHAQGKKVYLTLNQPGYAQDLYKEILAFVKEIKRNCKVDAFIVADPGLIRMLIEKEPDIVIHVSSLAGVLNSSAALFFKKLGVKRVVFPRYLEAKTLKKIIDRAGEDLEYEVFILNDGCMFEESYCHVSHQFGGAFCHNPVWRYKLIPPEEGGILETWKLRSLKISGETFENNVSDLKRWQWIGIKNSGGYVGAKYPPGMCGLCTLPEYRDMGVTSLKIVGREASLHKKVKSVELLKKVLAYQSEGHMPDEVRDYARTNKGARILCESGYMCYER